jgi:hypothetical protein
VEWEQIFHRARDGNAEEQNEAYHEIYRWAENHNWHRSDGMPLNYNDRQESIQRFAINSIKPFERLRGFS